jgi:hypothetical protein
MPRSITRYRTYDFQSSCFSHPQCLRKSSHDAVVLSKSDTAIPTPGRYTSHRFLPQLRKCGQRITKPPWINVIVSHGPLKRYASRLLGLTRRTQASHLALPWQLTVRAQAKPGGNLFSTHLLSLAKLPAPTSPYQYAIRLMLFSKIAT